MKNSKISYIVWKRYQRRAEVIAARLEAELEFMPHLFKSKYLRPLDYFLKFIATIRHIKVHQPNVVFFQGPPLFSAVVALLMGIPYVIDAHNVAIQGFWRKLPLSKYLMKRASAVIVHNHQILNLAQKHFPSTHLVSILDTLEFISRPNKQRLKNQIFVLNTPALKGGVQ